MKTASFCLILLLAPAFLWDASAQNTGNGVVRLYDWALSTDDFENGSFAIDSLTLGYGYRIANDRPYMAFAVEWAEGSAAQVDSLSIVSLSVIADVVVEGGIVAELGLFVDSLMLAPYPDLATLEYVDVDWERLFEKTTEEEARTYFASGFSLANLRIDEVAFSPPLLEEPVVANNSTSRERRRGGRVIRPRGGIIIDIPIYREPPRYVPRGSSSDAGRTTQPRGEQVGRGGRTADERDSGSETDDSDSSRDSSSSDDEDEDEDDKELMPAALVGVAAIAAVAVAGGTVGYYGNTKNAPIGLAAGFVRQQGGAVLQVAVNEAVIHRSGLTPERGLARIVGFYDVLDAPIMPAIGAGVLVTERASDFEYDFSLSAGFAASMGPVLLLGGVDIMSGGLDVGLAYNFKFKR